MVMTLAIAFLILGPRPDGMEGMLDVSGSRVLNFEPTITVSLDDSCRLQARLMVETRTNPYQVRRDEFPEDQITVYFTVRQYGSLDPEVSYEEKLDQLRLRCDELMESYVINQVLRPLQQAISTR